MDQNSFDDVQKQLFENAKDMFRNYETPNVVNRDNEFLHPWGPIGHVDEVNGPGAVEVSEFVPTRHELVQLVKYWATRRLDMDFFSFLYETTGSHEIRLRPFATRRISRIAECLGEATVNQAFQEAENEFAKTVDARAWQVFLHGTREEVAAFHDEVQQKLAEIDGGVVDIGGVKAVAIPQSELRPMEDLVDVQRDGGDENDEE